MCLCVWGGEWVCERENDRQEDREFVFEVVTFILCALTSYSRVWSS